MNVRKYGESTLADQRDPRWKAIRRTLHEQKIGCVERFTPTAGGMMAKCALISVTHNRAATAILDALNEI